MIFCWIWVHMGRPSFYFVCLSSFFIPRICSFQPTIDKRAITSRFPWQATSTAAKQQYVKLPLGANGCPMGSEILTFDECRQLARVSVVMLVGAREQCYYELYWHILFLFSMSHLHEASNCETSIFANDVNDVNMCDLCVTDFQHSCAGLSCGIKP